MTIKMLLVALFAAFILIVASSSIEAKENNLRFPSCPHPGGTLISEFKDGLHQIAGGSLIEGSDFVFKLEDNLFIQCFCPKTGNNGIQSTWVHESLLTSSKQQRLLDRGFIKISNGLDWGLTSGA